jgi:hypothetical protein
MRAGAAVMAFTTLLGGAGCGVLLATDTTSDPPVATVEGGAEDAGDAAPSACLTTAFGAPAPLAGLASPADENGAWPFGADEIFFGRIESDGLYAVSRARRAGSGFVVVGKMTGLLDGARSPSLSTDGLRLYYETADGTPEKIVFAVRTSTTDDFVDSDAGSHETHGGGGGSLITPYVTANALWYAAAPTISNGGTTEIGPYDIYRATFTGDGDVGPAIAEPSLATPTLEQNPVLTPDELQIYFASDRPGSSGVDVWTATRKRREDGFDSPTLVTELSSNGDDYPTWISPDGCRILLRSNRADAQGKSTNHDIYVSERGK